MENKITEQTSKINLEKRIAEIAKVIIQTVGLTPNSVNRFVLRDDLSVKDILSLGVYWSYPSDLCIFCKQDGHPDELEQLNVAPINYLCEMPPEFLFMADEEIIARVKKDLKK